VTLGASNITIDPKRSIANANPGEAYLKLSKISEAKKALSRYLKLAPNTRYASEIAGKLKNIE
jgi:regulator of sirC expression with transglutaminase-like and TPR domain